MRRFLQEMLHTLRLFNSSHELFTFHADDVRNLAFLKILIPCLGRIFDDFGSIEDKFGHDAFGPGDDFFKSFVAFGTTLAHTFKLLAEPLDFVLEMLDRFILASAAFVSTQIPKLTRFIASFIIDEPPITGNSYL